MPFLCFLLISVRRGVRWMTGHAAGESRRAFVSTASRLTRRRAVSPTLMHTRDEAAEPSTRRPQRVRRKKQNK